MSTSARFLAKLGLKVPIIQAPMANISTSHLASAVCKSGGLGSLALSPIDLTKDVEPVFAEIGRFRNEADSSAIVNCNFFCFDPKEQTVPTTEEKEGWVSLYSRATTTSAATVAKNIEGEKRAVVSFREFEQSHPDDCEKFINRLISEKVGVVSFHFGAPSVETIRRLQSGGITVFGCVTSVEEAANLVNLGIDVLVCQGYEAGGHRGTFSDSHIDEKLSTKELFKRVKSYVDGNVASAPLLVPSGGIVNGTTISEYLAEGAAAVQLGTVFIPTLESAAPAYIGDCIGDKTRHLPTVMTPLISGRNARTLATPFISKLSEVQDANRYSLPSFGYATSAYREFAKGNSEYGFYLAGGNYASVIPGLTTAEVMRRLISEMSGEI